MEEIYLDTFGNLTIDSNTNKVLFPEKCDLLVCGGKCCYYGVILDKLEVENILRYRDDIISVMDETQNKDSSQWFDEYVEDMSMPSGIASGTQVYLKKCVFLNKKSCCSLQIVEEAGKNKIKPFYCKIFPYTIDNNTISIDEYHINRIGGCSNRYYVDIPVGLACKKEKQLVEKITKIKIG